MTSNRLTTNELAAIDAWPTPRTHLGLMCENRMRRAVAEIRERRAADLDAGDLDAVRVARDEMQRFAFLPEIPRLIAALDKVLAAHGAKP
jgi:hypothetical protein